MLPVHPRANSTRSALQPFVDASADIDWTDDTLPVCRIREPTPGLEANRRYFDHADWAQKYFAKCHRDENFRLRWQAATGSWNDKIVVDVGCGPGNVFATVGGTPKLLIGVDVSRGALAMARRAGYQPILSDAQALPFISGFADIVVVNAVLHHCDDMAGALREAGRLVAPGGTLVTDHDPQLSAWNFTGPAKWAWNLRLHVYRWFSIGFHGSIEEQGLGIQSEIHHLPGRGVTHDMYTRNLRPLGFAVETYGHNHDVGASVLDGDFGIARAKYRIAQRLSGVDPNSAAGALSILCRARRSA